MVYCSNCGNQLSDDAYFCPKCGTKTEKGKAAKATYPSDEIRDAFYQVGLELEKAFTLAAQETKAAFKKVNENLQQKTSQPSQPSTQGMVVCPKCATKNPAGSIFCYNCGTRIAPIEESHGAT
jgi:hypothetical protein